MKKVLITLAIVFGSLFFVIGLLAYKVYEAASIGNVEENAILAQYKDGRNILGQFTTKLKEMAQVTEMSVEAQERIITAVFGEDGRAGNKAAWQWVQEQNPQADISLFNPLSQVADAFRNKFANHQTAMLARCQNYRTQLNAPIGQFFFRFAGYPDKNVEKDYTVAKMCTPIESTHSRKAFETGVDDGVDLKSGK